MKHYLIIHTRELCYYSGSFFLDQLQKRMEGGWDFLENIDTGNAEKIYKGKIQVTRMDLVSDDADFDLLEPLSGQHFDAIIDINSKLPYLQLDDGSYLLDHIDAPFYNWILDHPLYHHPGLCIPLKNYHALGIDMEHCDYMRRWYPHLKSVTYFPVPGVCSDKQIPYERRKFDLLFSGTYPRKDPYEEQIENLGPNTVKLIYQVADKWKPRTESMEDFVNKFLRENFGQESYEKILPGYYGVNDFPELMNYIYLADKFIRRRMRYVIIKKIADAGLPLTILGNGWDLTDIPTYSNVTWLPGVTIAESIDIIADTKVLLDINPLFRKGLHDRVSTGLVNGCQVVTNMNPIMVRGLILNTPVLSKAHGLENPGPGISFYTDESDVLKYF